MKMKKWITVLLTAILCVALGGCGNSEKKMEQGRLEALTEWPWLAGEWYTPFGENVLTFAADGYFQFNGQPGVWTWESDRGGNDTIVPLTVYSESGECFHVDIIREGDEWIRAMIQNADTFAYTDVGHYMPGVGEGEIRTRERIQEDRAKASMLMGQWFSAENDAGYSPDVPFLELREDGTCMILGDEGVWGLSDSQKELVEADYLLIKTEMQDYGVQIDRIAEEGHWLLFIHKLSFEGSGTLTFDLSTNQK